MHVVVDYSSEIGDITETTDISRKGCFQAINPSKCY